MVFNCFIAAISESLTIYCNVCRNIFQVFHRKLGIDCLLPHPRRPRNFRIWTIYYIQQVLWRRRIRLRTARPLDHCVLNRKRNQRDKTQPGFGSNRSRLNHESSFEKKFGVIGVVIQICLHLRILPNLETQSIPCIRSYFSEKFGKQTQHSVFLHLSDDFTIRRNKSNKI